MNTYEQQALIALANMNLAHKERAVQVTVTSSGNIGIATERADGKGALYVHAGGNVWEHTVDGETREVHYIDRDTPRETGTYADGTTCDACHPYKCDHARVTDADRVAEARRIQDACIARAARMHVHAEGDIVAHVDSPDQVMVVKACTWREVNGMVVPTYTLVGRTNGAHDEVDDVLCTRDLIAI